MYAEDPGTLTVRFLSLPVFRGLTSLLELVSSKHIFLLRHLFLELSISFFLCGTYCLPHARSKSMIFLEGWGGRGYVFVSFKCYRISTNIHILNANISSPANYFKKLFFFIWAGKVAQLVNKLAPKPDALSSTPQDSGGES